MLNKFKAVFKLILCYVKFAILRFCVISEESYVIILMMDAFYINTIYSLGLKLLSINCMLTTMHTKFEVLFLFKIGKVKFKIFVIYVPCQTRHVILDLVTVFANELIELVPPREWCLEWEL